jgi:hypothetical protein
MESSKMRSFTFSAMLTLAGCSSPNLKPPENLSPQSKEIIIHGSFTHDPNVPLPRRGPMVSPGEFGE